MSFLSLVDLVDQWAYFEFSMWKAEYLIFSEHSGICTRVYQRLDGLPIQRCGYRGECGKICRVQKTLELGVSPLTGCAEEPSTWSLKGLYCHQAET